MKTKKLMSSGKTLSIMCEPTIGSKVSRRPITTVSTTVWPRVGMSFGRPAAQRMAKMSTSEKNHVVTIEFVTDSPPT
jgi:hypothetical protein